MNATQRMRDLRDRAYCIKEGYTALQSPRYFVDALAETEQLVHQPDAYPFAAEVLRVLGGKTVVDLGCGRARKLASLHPEFDVIGVDFGENLWWCKDHYSFGTWIEHDLDRFPLAPPAERDLSAACLVCSDVIEHLSQPEFLLATVAEWLEQAPFALFTTPERDLVRGVRDCGPPLNPHHVREWNLSEFRELLECAGMEVWADGLTANNSRDREKKTIIALARRTGWKATLPSPDFRVLAVICAYNEGDIIEHTLQYLTGQGIRVVLIDNWSTDDTAVKARQFLDKGLLRIEKFPAGGPSGTYDWHRLLTRVEEIALEADADWIIHHDADEIREGPWSDRTLKQALFQVDREGYNCVNHACIVFHPTVESDARGGAIPDAMRQFEFGRRPGHLAQKKAWKKQPGRVRLAESGGHDVEFPGRKVYPLRFLLRHYPIRSEEHGRRKIRQERLARFNPEERRERGWHTQYDALAQQESYLRETKDLLFFDANRFGRDYFCERLACVGIDPVVTRAEVGTGAPGPAELRPSLLSSDVPRSESDAFYHLDALNAVGNPFRERRVEVAAGSALRIGGWAADRVAERAASAVEVVLDGTPYEATYGLERPDVAAHFQCAAYAHSGFQIVLPGRLAGTGPHEVRIRVISADRQTFWEGAPLPFECSSGEGEV